MVNKKNRIEKKEIDLKEVYNIFVKRKWWFLISVVIVLVLGIIIVLIIPSDYCTVTYQIKLEDNYYNKDLFGRYPEAEQNLNYITAENTPAIFQSTPIFESVLDLPEKIDYNDLLNSDMVKIIRSGDSAVFIIRIYDGDCSLNKKIGLTLINEFDDFARDKNKVGLDKILNKIKSDIANIEAKSTLFEEEISKLESRAEELYEEFDNYIVNYNISLSGDIREKSNTERVYNVVIPPNQIEDELILLREEVSLYKELIINNQDELIDLNVLYNDIIKDEEEILDRVELLSETPSVNSGNNRIRNIVVLLVFSIATGILTVFTSNFILNLRNKKKNK